MTETKDHLINVTERLLESTGVARVTTRMIALEAGVAEGLIYHYFKDKAELIHAVFEYRVNDVRQVIEKLPSLIGLGTVAGNIEKTAMEIYSIQYKITPLMSSVFADRKIRERMKEIMECRQVGPKKEIESLAVYISAEQRMGRIASDINPISVARLLLSDCSRSAMHDSFLGLAPDRPEAKKNIRDAVDTLMKGLEPRENKIPKKTRERVKQ